MARDLKKLFEEERKRQSYTMDEGHEDRFLAKLEEALPKRNRPRFYGLRIAASIAVFVAIGSYFLLTDSNPTVDPKTTVVENSEQPASTISLGDLSPELKQVENYYVANINLELADLEVSEANKGIVDGYMEQLEQLDLEYQNLTQELNEYGPNDQTIGALIKNLQLRLQLLQKLKSKLNQLKSSKNEQQTTDVV
ncbi:hypothetical protein ABV409_11630 [Flagellimonas sp. DF-77]|uniref:hypothetical protein n=1 Tax=Flagellimonas algarum TaxID=3230298 RepID=UPI0033949DAD